MESIYLFIYFDQLYLICPAESNLITPLSFSCSSTHVHMEVRRCQFEVGQLLKDISAGRHICQSVGNHS